jgi:hypothetical protein
MTYTLSLHDALPISWPKALRVGGGVNAMLLLQDVAIGYELWRNINGFPPDFYIEKVSKDANSIPKK